MDIIMLEVSFITVIIYFHFLWINPLIFCSHWVAHSSAVTLARASFQPGRFNPCWMSEMEALDTLRLSLMLL